MSQDRAAPDERPALEVRWLQLTRKDLPQVAKQHCWPISADHCFQRVLLDNACGGCWYDHIAGRPAYRHIDIARLRLAIELGEGALCDPNELSTMNNRSLGWRRKRVA